MRRASARSSGRRRGSARSTRPGAAAYRKGEPVFVELSGCVSRYHAPLGRLVRIGGISSEDALMAEIAAMAFDAVVKAIRPGAQGARGLRRLAGRRSTTPGLSHYRRHHCGYVVGVGQPPSWTGGNSVTGLRHDFDLEIETGMSFHILSWLMGTGRGDDFISNTVLLTDKGAEVLTRTPAGPIIR